VRDFRWVTFADVRAGVHEWSWVSGLEHLDQSWQHGRHARELPCNR
jgi:hypothetical protein